MTKFDSKVRESYRLHKRLNEGLTNKIGVFRAFSGNMTLLLTFVAGFVLVKVSCSGASGSVVQDGPSPRRSQTIPGHMIRAAATVAFDGGQGRGVQGTTWRRSTGGETGGTQSAIRASTSNMAKTAAVVALLITTLLLDPQTGTLRLNVANSATRITLFRRNCTRRWARRRLVAWLTAVVAKPLIRRTIFGNVTEVATLETALPRKLICHSQNNCCTRFSLFQLATNSLPPPLKGDC